MFHGGKERYPTGRIRKSVGYVALNWWRRDFLSSRTLNISTMNKERHRIYLHTLIDIFPYSWMTIPSGYLLVGNFLCFILSTLVNYGHIKLLVWTFSFINSFSILPFFLTPSTLLILLHYAYIFQLSKIYLWNHSAYLIKHDVYFAVRWNTIINIHWS